MNDKKTLKVILEGDAKAAAERMLEALRNKGEFSKLSPTRLLAWIILHFEKKDFPKYKEQILTTYFNPKKYLFKMALDIGESDNLEEVLKKALKDIKSGGNKKVKDAKEESDQAQEG